MVRLHRLVIVAVSASLLAGCSNIGNMFNSSGPERQINEAVIPDVKDTLKGTPRGLVADTENARHTGQTLIPQ